MGNALTAKRLFLVFCVGMLTIGSGCRESKPATERTPSSANQTDSKLPAQAPWFEDVTSAAGIDFVHVRATKPQFWLPEITSGGVGWIDFDQDGDLDLYFIQGGELDPAAPAGPGNVLYENLGDGTFADATSRAGVGDQHYGMGVAVGDYDADGFPDIYVTNVGPNVLYRNQGDGTFADVTAVAGVGHSGWGTSASFVDYDADGDLDLFVTNYLRWSPDKEMQCLDGAKRRDYCAPTAYQAPSVDTLYRNRGDGTFEDVSNQVGLAASSGNGLGVAVGDFDLNGRLDFYVANDGNPNHLWLQKEPHRFVDQALISGCAVNRVGAAEAGMGVAAVDLDQDGDLDLFMTHLFDETNTLYVNSNGVFRDQTASSGLAAPSLRYTGFGMGFVDFDHDGHQDLYVANGRVSRRYEPISTTDPFGEPNQLFQGQPDGRFVEVMPRGGAKPVVVATSRAAAFADYDRDGGVDVAVVNSGGRAQVLKNRAAPKGNWVRFDVVRQDGREAIGALVRIQTDQGVQWRAVQRAYSFLASNELPVHFGIGEAAQILDVSVTWSQGETESYGPRQSCECHELVEGRGAREPTAREHIKPAS